MENFDSYIESHQDEFIEELKAFCAQPSIAATGEGLEEMAQIVRQTMEGIGADIKMLEIGPNDPSGVYATLGEGDRSLLIYNHYDVQPADPLELWDTPPFEPTVRDDKIYGRGVSDNKGHVLQRVQAIRAWQATMGPLPFKINWFIEGAEEIGSPDLAAFCLSHSELFKADGCLWEMGGVDIDENPVFACGAKGDVYFELRVRAINGDQHSALATIVPNAAWRLNWALSTLKAPDETILIEGLMDHVVPPTPAERALLEAMPFNEAAMKAHLGINEWVGGLSGVEALERHLFQPTCTISGFDAGYTGEGSKTVLPAQAMAKLDIRLVPNLEPELVANLLRAHLDKHGFNDIEIEMLSGEYPGKSDPNSDVTQAALAAAKEIYPGKPPVLYPMTPGTGPVWAVAIGHGTPLISFGCSYPGANIHAPNENLRIKDYVDGIKMMGRFIGEFGKG